MRRPTTPIVTMIAQWTQALTRTITRTMDRFTFLAKWRAKHGFIAPNRYNVRKARRQELRKAGAR